MNKMNLCFVENEPETIQSVITDLRATGLFHIVHYTSYQQVVDSRIGESDLFILDVLTGTNNTSDAFVHFVRSLAHHKPFVAFTIASDNSPIGLPSGVSMGLREFVLTHGGLGVIQKSTESGERWRSEMRLDVIERVLWFYWCRQQRPAISKG